MRVVQRDRIATHPESPVGIWASEYERLGIYSGDVRIFVCLDTGKVLSGNPDGEIVLFMKKEI